jgi:hypothetical protein
MAEIKVEPKRGGLGWLWAIIVIALIAAAVWYFMNNSRAVPATTPADSVRTSMLDQPRSTFSARTFPNVCTNGCTNVFARA